MSDDTVGQRRIERKHRLRNVDVAALIAECAECGPGIPIFKSGPVWKCKLGKKEQDRRYVLQRLAKRRAELLPACEICGAAENLCWDHNHQTGAYRGTLCSLCNTGIGLLQDNPALAVRAAEYLLEASQEAQRDL